MSTSYHIVYSPLNKEDLNNYKLADDLRKHYNNVLISEEKGESKHPTHLDIVAFGRNKPVRVDNECLRLKKLMKIEKGNPEWSVALKCYEIKDGELEWQLGYSRKEEGLYTVKNINEEYLNKCIEVYKADPQRRDRALGAKRGRSWGPDRICQEYVDHLKLQELQHTQGNWQEFLVKEGDNVSYSSYSKISKKKLEEFVKIKMGRKELEIEVSEADLEWYKEYSLDKDYPSLK